MGVRVSLGIARTSRSNRPCGCRSLDAASSDRRFEPGAESPRDAGMPVPAAPQPVSRVVRRDRGLRGHPDRAPARTLPGDSPEPMAADHGVAAAILHDMTGARIDFRNDSPVKRRAAGTVAIFVDVFRNLLQKDLDRRVGAEHQDEDLTRPAVSESSP